MLVGRFIILPLIIQIRKAGGITSLAAGINSNACYKYHRSFHSSYTLTGVMPEKIFVECGEEVCADRAAYTKVCRDDGACNTLFE